MLTIVLLGVGYYREFAFKTLLRRQCQIVLVDKPSKHRYFALADIPIMVDPEDTARVLEILQHLKIKVDGVLTFTDTLVSATAILNQALGLPGISPNTAVRASNKLLMREAFLQHSLLTPEFATISNALEAYETAEKIGYPVVVKPVDYSGSIGVTRVDQPSELEPALKRAQKHTQESVTLIEKFLSGREFYVNSVIHDGHTLVSFVSDRTANLPGPFFAELGYNILSNLPLDKQQELILIAEKGATSLGIKNGIVHVEIIWSNQGCYIVEIGARAAGGLQVDAIYLSHGVNLYNVALDLAIGNKPEIKLQTPPQGSAVRNLVTQGGKVVSISGIQETVETIEGINDFAIYVSPGDITKSPKSNAAFIGHIVVNANSGDLAVEKANRAVEMIKIIVI